MKSTLVFQKMKKIIEALLFAAREPLTAERIKEILDLQDEAINAALEEFLNSLDPSFKKLIFNILEPDLEAALGADLGYSLPHCSCPENAYSLNFWFCHRLLVSNDRQCF